MFECAVCRFEVVLDDAKVTLTSHGWARCICLRCFRRIVEDTHEMPADMRRQVTQAANAAGPGGA